MKTKLVILVCLLVVGTQSTVLAGSGRSTVNEKIVKAFRDAFPLAEKVDWIEKGDHVYVHFKEHEVLSEIEYDHDGNFLFSERYYTNADMLPLHLSWELHKKFHDKTVFGVTEATTESETFYFIKMEDSMEWITIKATSDGSMQVTEKFNKLG